LNGTLNFLPDLGLSEERRDVHGIYIPELALDIKAEAARLRKIMDKHDCVNLFISEGAGVSSIVKEMESRGEEVPRDAFGHVRLDKVNVGSWFSKQFAELLGAEKTLVQKSGYYSRAAAANAADRKLIKRCAIKAVECALAGKGGVVGEDEERGNKLRAIEFERIKGGKPFDTKNKWFVQLLKAIGQPMGKVVAVKH
jgi:pyrophosphate--fructose-6-phosphate 1-phosphotransferase